MKHDPDPKITFYSKASLWVRCKDQFKWSMLQYANKRMTRKNMVAVFVLLQELSWWAHLLYYTRLLRWISWLLRCPVCPQSLQSGTEDATSRRILNPYSMVKFPNQTKVHNSPRPCRPPWITRKDHHLRAEPEVIFEDPDFLVISKPPFWHCTNLDSKEHGPEVYRQVQDLGPDSSVQRKQMADKLLSERGSSPLHDYIILRFGHLEFLGIPEIQRGFVFCMVFVWFLFVWFTFIWLIYWILSPVELQRLFFPMYLLLWQDLTGTLGPFNPGTLGPCPAAGLFVAKGNDELLSGVLNKDMLWGLIHRLDSGTSGAGFRLLLVNQLVGRLVNFEKLGW